MRLINADKLSADMYHEAFEKDSDMQKWDSGCWIRYKMFENVLKAQPSAEPDTTTHDSIPVENGQNDGDRTSGDCISRQQAIEGVRELFSMGDCYCDEYAIVGMLNTMPFIQPERKTGHWVEIGDEPYDEWECDVCGFAIDGSGCIDPEEYRDVYKFCPNCGADMRPTERRTDG